MTTIQKIYEIYRELDGLSFVCDNWSKVNKTKTLSTQATLPAMVVLERAAGTFHNANANFRDYHNLVIGFIADPAYQSDGIENSAVLEHLKAQAEQFIKLYNSCGLFEPLPVDIVYTDVFALLGETAQGITFEISVRKAG